MLFPITVHSLFVDGEDITARHLAQTSDILSSTLSNGWNTRVEIKLFEQQGLDNDRSDSQILEDLADFPSTAWGIVDGCIIISDDVSPHNIYEGLVERPRGLSYLDRSVLELIRPPHTYNTPSNIDPALAIHKDVPESLVASYMHPTMTQLCPRSLLNPSGNIESSSSLLHSSSPTHQSTETITQATWKHMRVAWIVPIRGKIPWPNASNGWILTDDEERRKSPYITSREYTQPIMWTPSLLRGLWKHLARHQKRNTLGPLAFALVPAEDGFPDMIKVWCDATMALKVRTLLSVFYMEPPEDQIKALALHKAKTAAEEREMREDALITPLRRCRLMMLDDTGKPLLIS